MAQQIPGAPPNIASAIDELIDALTRAAGSNLAGLILYGGLARGRFRPGNSDVNIVVLLRDASSAALTAIAPALQAARRSAGVEPLILTPTEVSEAADVFPTKFLDIKRHHVVLVGEDPFATLEVSRENLRLRIEQELRNMLLRFRHLSVDAMTDTQFLARSLARFSRPLAIELDALLRLAEKPAPTVDRTSAIFEAAALAFDLKAEPLARLAAMRQQSNEDTNLAGLYGEMLDIIARAVDIADKIKG